MLDRLGCTDASFPLLRHDAVFALVRALDLRAIDVSLVGGQSHIRPEELARDIAGCAAHVRSLARSHELAINDVFLIPDGDLRRMSVNHPDDRERAGLRDALALAADFAVAIGAPGLTIPPGLPWPHEPLSTSLRRAAEELVRLVEYAQRRGLVLCVEPHLGSTLDAPERAAELLELTPGLALTLDPSHFVAAGAPQGEIAPLLSRSRHLHLRGARKGHLQVRNAQDATDLPALAAAMREHRFAGTASLEYIWLDWQGCNQCDTISETALLRDRLRTACAGIKQVPSPTAPSSHA